MRILNIQDIKGFRTGYPIVFVTGVTGQDGSHMVDYLLKNTEATVIGGARRLSVDNHENVKHLANEPRFRLVNFDLTDAHSVYGLVEASQPDYFINFAAQSFVASSWDFAQQTWACNSTGVLNCLEAIRRFKPECRFYNAGSSEEFGNVAYSPQNEDHPARPRSPYGASKSAARCLVKVYRESYNIYAVQGWLFNHEGTRRGEEFVTRKITKGVARIRKTIDIFTKGVEGISPRRLTFDPIELGNMDAKRDWSDAEDCVDAVWRMLNQDTCNDELSDIPKGKLLLVGAKWHPQYEYLIPRLKEYIVSSGENHTIREFVEESFKAAGISGNWGIKDDDPLTETFVLDAVDGCGDVPFMPLVKVNPKFYRPAEVETLLGDSSLIRKDLKWNPKTTFKGLVEKMVQNDLLLTR